MPLTRGGRSTVSENVDESGASERPSSPSKSTKAASDAVNSSRRLRSDKKIAKNEPTSTVVSTGKVEKKQSEECVKDKQQESETPTVRETRRTRRSTESAVNNPPANEPRSKRRRDASESAAAPSEAQNTSRKTTDQKGDTVLEGKDKEKEEAEKNDHLEVSSPTKQSEGLSPDIEVKNEDSQAREDRMLRSSSRQRKPTARYNEMIEMEKRKHQKHERTPLKSTSSSAERHPDGDDDGGAGVLAEPNDHGDGVSDASNAKKRRLGDSQNISVATPKRDALRNEIGSETVLRQTDGYNDDDGYEETVVVDELGSMGSDDRQLDDEDFEPGGSMTRSRFIETRQKQGYSGGSGAGVSGMSARSTLRSRVSVGSILPPPTISMENAVPATAPLLTTDRTKIRHNKRNKTEDRDAKEVVERVVVGRRYDRIPSVSTPSTTAVSTMSSSLSSHQQPRILDRRSGGLVDTSQQRLTSLRSQQQQQQQFYSPRSPRRTVTIREHDQVSYPFVTRSYREDAHASRYLESIDGQEFIPQGQQIIINEDGEEVIYEPIEVGDEEIIEEHIGEDGETLIFTEADLEMEEEVETTEEQPQDPRSCQTSSTEMERRRAQLKKEQAAATDGTGVDGSTSAEGADAAAEVGSSMDVAGGKEGRPSGGDEDEEAPPHLDPEGAPVGEEVLEMDNVERTQETEYIEGMGEVIRVQSPGGTQQFIQVNGGQPIDDETYYIDENGMLLDEPAQQDLRAVEFNFLDNKNICCGLCGEIVPYDLLMSEHLPTQHPDVLGDGGSMDFEEIPYEVWLRDKLSSEKKHMENGFRSAAYDPLRLSRSTRVLRRVSQVRVNPNEMSLAQLDNALRKKMVEKMGRKVPVTLVDKQHARCGICNAVVSLNRKFEVVHLVRHFNAWHPSAHRCAGTWKDRSPQPGMGKPLSTQDFAVIDTSLDVGDNLQCIWCGMFMDTDALAMHFSEVHPDEVEVPKCNLCLQELVINARLTEKYGEEFGVSLPDEHHIRCAKFETIHTSEAALDKLIERRLRRLQAGGADSTDAFMSDEDDEEDEQTFGAGPEAYLNSRMSFGRRSKPKRHFIMPALRQAAPIGSKYVEPVTECHWRCKLCKGDILAAVISAGAIRHFRATHPDELENMQYELCKARLERVSDGCMEFVHPQLIECLVCNMTYALHKPFNMCRAIRHLKSKHPDMMPEYAGMRDRLKNMKQKRQAETEQQMNVESRALNERVDENGFITDPETIAMLRAQYGVDFEKVQALEGADGERVYVLMGEGEEIDDETAQQLAATLSGGDAEMGDANAQQSSDEQQQHQETQDDEDSQPPTAVVEEEVIGEETLEAEQPQGEILQKSAGGGQPSQGLEAEEAEEAEFITEE